MLVVMPWRDTGCEWRRRAHDHTVAWWSRFAEVVEADAGGDLFSRSDSLNLAVERADPDVIVAVDADMLIAEHQVAEAVALAAEAPGMVLPFDEGRYLTPDATEAAYAGADPWTGELAWVFHPDASTPLVGGCNVLSRETFDAVGGWPLGFAGWGNQDIAFADLCERVAPLRRVVGPYIHLHHPKTGDYVSAETKAANARRLAEIKGTP